MNLHHRFEQIAMQGSKSQQTGFILPALVVISLVLVSMGVVALQYVTASSNSIQSTNFTSVAKNAANAGIQHALSCLDEQFENWTSLTPATDCMGDESIGGASETLSQGGTWRSTYTVSPADERDGQLLVTATGRVEFFYAGATVASKTFSATSKASVPVNAAGDERPVAQGRAVTKVSAGEGITCAIANMQLYCSGELRNARMTTGTNPSTYYSSPTLIEPTEFVGKAITDIQVTTHNHCAIANGQSYCWGRNNAGPVGDNTSTTYKRPTPPSSVAGFDAARTRIASPSKYREINEQSTCFLNQLRVFCSGANTFAQLGRSYITRNCFIGCGAWYIRDDPHYSAAHNNTGIRIPHRVYGFDTSNENGNIPAEPSKPYASYASQSQLYGQRPTHLESGGGQVCTLVNARVFCWGDRFMLWWYDYTGFPADIGNVTAPSGWKSPSNQTVTAFGAGGSTSCYVANGELYCWGFRPGHGSTALQSGGPNPEEVHQRWVTHKAPNNTTTRALYGVNVEGFNSHVDNYLCAYGDGDAFCWGPGSTAGNVSPSANWPSRVIAGADLSPNRPSVTDVSAGFDHICVVANGSQYCRGHNNYGSGATARRASLGTGNLSHYTTSNYTTKATAQSSPSSSTGIGLTEGEAATKIASGDNHSCAIANSYVYCWGNNQYGQVGDGSTIQRNQPHGIIATTGLKTRAATHIATGARHSCAIIGGKVYCWGDNSHGQLGNGTVGGNSATPAEVTMPSGYKATSIDAGAEHTCAIANGRAYCWGRNTRGQLGNTATATNRPTPYPVSGLSSGTGDIPTQITTGDNFTCAIANARAYCWGDNTQGQVGRNSSTSLVTTPYQVPPGTGITAGEDEWISIDAGSNFACANINRVVRCWGNNTYGQLGRNNTTNPTGGNFTPQTVTSTVSGQNVGWKRTTVITAGASHACAIADGESYCWGRNNQGQVGDGSTSQRNDTRLVSRLSGFLTENNIYTLSAGGQHTCGIANGKIICWGFNSNGQLGDVTTSSRASPNRWQGTYLREGRSVNADAATIY